MAVKMTITIENFLDALEKAHSGMDITTCWPVHPAQIEASFSDLVAMRVFNKWKENKEKFLEGISRVPVDSIRAYLCSAGLIGLKVARVLEHKDINIRETENFILDILGNIQERVFNDALCRDGRNLLYPLEKVENWLANGIVSNLSEEGKKAVAGLNIASESLSWSMFYDMYRSGGFVISGPYETSKGKVLIRENIDLTPPFWPFRCKYSWLREILVYDENVEVTGDFANHFIYNRPIVLKLKGFKIETNREKLNTMESITELIDYFEELRRKHTEYVESLKPLDVIKNGAKIYSYLYKDLWQSYGENWIPDREVIKRIEKNGLKYWHEYGLAREQEEEEPVYYRKLYDPRNDFVE